MNKSANPKPTSSRRTRTPPPGSSLRGGVDFAYRELGPKGGVPVVFFVHLAATLDNWDPRIIDPIAARRHAVAFDKSGLPRP